MLDRTAIVFPRCSRCNPAYDAHEDDSPLRCMRRSVFGKFVRPPVFTLATTVPKLFPCHADNVSGRGEYGGDQWCQQTSTTVYDLKISLKLQQKIARLVNTSSVERNVEAAIATCPKNAAPQIVHRESSCGDPLVMKIIIGASVQTPVAPEIIRDPFKQRLATERIVRSKVQARRHAWCLLTMHTK